MNVFDLTGRYLRVFRLEPQPRAQWATVVTAGESTIIGKSIQDAGLRGPPGSIIVSTFRYAVFDSLGTQRASLFELPARPRFVHAYGGVTHYPFIPFTVDPMVAVSGNKVFLSRGEANEIEVWSTSGKRTATWTWSVHHTRVRDIWRRYTEIEYAKMTEARDRTLYGHYYSMELPLPTHVPVASQLQVDPAGNLWVERFRLPWETERRWDVLDSGGRFLGTVASPGSLEVYQVGADFLLGRSRDSLDIEQVQVFRLTRGR